MNVLLMAAPNFALVEGQPRLEATIPPGAIYALAPILEGHGSSTTILDPYAYNGMFHAPGELERLLSRFDVVCVSSNTATWPVARWLMNRVARGRRCTIIAGGVHVSHCAEHAIQHSAADVIVRGEGERTLPALLRAITAGSALDEIPGITYQVNGEVRRNPDAAPLSVEELDAVPLPLWERMPEGVYWLFPVELSRGCHYACRFCSIYHKHDRRGYSLANVERRVEQAIRMLPRVRHPTLMFSDDCFTSDVDAMNAVAASLAKAGPDVEVGIEARATDVIRPEVLGAITKMKSTFIQIGAEAGYAEGLRRIRKGITVEDLIESAERLRSVGLMSAVKYSYIVGFPWESTEDMKRTIAFAFGLGAKFGGKLQINWCMVWPGSEVYDELAQQELVWPGDFDEWDHGPELFFRTHPTLSREGFFDVTDFANRLARTFPWVCSFGSVFDGIPSRGLPRLKRDIPDWVGRAPLAGRLLGARPLIHPAALSRARAERRI